MTAAETQTLRLLDRLTRSVAGVDLYGKPVDRIPQRVEPSPKRRTETLHSIDTLTVGVQRVADQLVSVGADPVEVIGQLAHQLSVGTRWSA